MKQITQTLASQIANAITEKLTKELEVKEEHLEALFGEMYRHSLPKVIADGYAKNPDFFYTSKSVSVYGNGFNSELFKMNVSAPNERRGWTPIFEPNKTQAATLQKMKRAIDLLRDKRDKIRKDITQALLTLKTRKNIEVQLPEAVPFLPKEVISTALIPNLSGLRKELTEISK